MSDHVNYDSIVPTYDQRYAAGIVRLHTDLGQAEAQGQTLRFEVDLRMPMVLARA